MGKPIAQSLADEAARQGVPIKRLAEHTGIDRAVLSKTMSGKRDRIYVHEAEAIAASLGMTLQLMRKN